MTQAAVLAQMGNTNQTFRNRIMNGSMTLDQRGTAGAPVAGNNVYGLDRWLNVSDTSNKWTFQQNSGSVTPPAGFKYYLGAVSSSAYTPLLSTDYFGFQQRIEGYNIADLAWGTASAASITVSFWVRSSLTGTFGGAVLNNTQDYNYPFSYTISSANTWEYKTVVIAGPTSGTWETTTSAGIKLFFSLGAGSSRVGTANTWTSTANVFAPSGATNVVSTNAATFYITGVQLEAGTKATPFEQRSYGVELVLCQRYFARVFDPAMRGVGTGGSSGGASRMALFFPQTMRAKPTLTTSGTFNFWDGSGSTTSTSLAGYFQGGYNSIDMDFNITGSFTAGKAICAYCTGSSTIYVDLLAEL